MSAGLTGLMLIAGVGLLNNKGLGVNNRLKTEVQKFNTTNISGRVQARLEGASEEIIDALGTAPSFLTGFCPPGITIGNSSNITNVPQAVLDQGNSLFSPPVPSGVLSTFDLPTSSVSSFTSIYSAASGYAAQTFSFTGSLAAAQGKNFDDMGFQFANYTDVISGGITNQFDPEGLPALAEQLPALGTMFDTNDLSRINDPITLAQNLIDQGLGYVGGLEDKLNESQIDLSDPYPSDTDREIVRNILAEISGSDLEEVFSVTEFNPAYKEKITSLADVLEIDNLFDEEALSALGDNPTLDTFANKMTNIGGSFPGTASIGKFFSSLDLRSFPTLAGLGALLPAGLTDGLTNILGKGTGIFGNPTVNDMTSSASGIDYVDYITFINDIQQTLLSQDSDVQALAEYLDTEENLDAGLLTVLIDNIATKPNLQSVIAKGEEYIRKTADKLSIEKSNLSAAGITPGSAASNNGGLLNFSSNLHGLGVDPMNLGLGKQITELAQPGLEGEAMAASIVEGKNLGKLAVFGIDPGTKMDPMDYAKSLANLA